MHIKRYLVGLVPLLVVAAFAVAPAMASAAGTREFGVCKTGHPHTTVCPGSLKFTAFTKVTKVVSSGSKFTLESVETEEQIYCASLSNTGTVENKDGIGTGSLALTYSGCEIATGELEGCPVANITGDVSVENESDTTVKVVLKADEFDVKTVAVGLCPELNLGDVSGTTHGTISGDKTIFTKEGGLTFRGEESTITGEDTLTVAPGEPEAGEGVYVN